MELETMAKLYAKLARVTQKMTRIRKTGKHPQGYKFATDTDIIEEVREAMADENMACLANMVGFTVEPAGLTSGDKPIFHTICEFEFVFVCGDTGATYACKWFNEALDSSDKGFNKAATAALKYFFMKTFQITTGEPDEHESGDLERSSGNAMQSRQNGSNSRSTRQQASTPTESPETAEWIATQVQVKLTKQGKPYLLYLCNDNKRASGRGRDLLRQAGYDCESWTEPESVYPLQPMAAITVERSGDYWNVTAVKQLESERVPF